jgi:hypothetical protein
MTGGTRNRRWNSHAAVWNEPLHDHDWRSVDDTCHVDEEAAAVAASSTCTMLMTLSMTSENTMTIWSTISLELNEDIVYACQ